MVERCRSPNQNFPKSYQWADIPCSGLLFHGKKREPERPGDLDENEDQGAARINTRECIRFKGYAVK